MKVRTSSILLACLAVSLAACGDGALEGTDVAQGRVIEGNGREINGREINGREINGTRFGVWYAQRGGASILDTPIFSARVAPQDRLGAAGIEVAGNLTALASIDLVGGQLFAVRKSGQRVGGAAFRNVYLVGRGPSQRRVGHSRGDSVVSNAGTLDVGGNVAVNNAPAATVTLTPAEKIRAFVARRLQETNVPEHDVSLRVTAALPSGPNNDFHSNSRGTRWHYRVDVKEPDGVWRPFCGAATGGGERLAIAVPDRFNYKQGLSRPRADGGTERGGAYESDPSAFTFACDNAAVAKCVEHLGYDPERNLGDIKPDIAPDARNKSARSLVESCTRMFRADYCGNGISMTLDGTEIEVFDAAQLNVPTEMEASWSMEASWRSGGASCGQTNRQACVVTGDGVMGRLSVKDYIQAVCPNVPHAQTVIDVTQSDDAQCSATHVFSPQALPGSSCTGGRPGRPGGGVGNLSFDGTALRPLRSCNGTSFTWTEWDVIWTKTRGAGTAACSRARPFGDVFVGGREPPVLTR